MHQTHLRPYKRQLMTDAYRAAHAGIARRDFMITGAGVAAFAAGLAGAGAAALGANLADAGTALAQAGPAPAAPPGPARPGNILVERRGSVLLIGIDRPDAQNRFDAPMLIGGWARHITGSTMRTSYARLCSTASAATFASASTAGPLPPRKPRASSRPRIRITLIRSV